LFTGDAGGGESNIRRYIIETIEAIVQLPNNLFYNTGLPLHLDTKQHKTANRVAKYN
jgi:type I restriction enzyme M protein